jgi:hypothetical protein
MFFKTFSNPEIKKRTDNDNKKNKEEEDVMICGNDCVNAVKMRILFFPYCSTIAPRVTIRVLMENYSWLSSLR